VDDWPLRAERSLTARGQAAWARGRALRHLGRHRQAGTALAEAVRLLARSGDRVAQARASVSLAVEHIDAGRFDEAIALLDAASGDLSGAPAARAAAQRAMALERAGRAIDSIGDWDRAVLAFEAEDLDLEAAITRQNRALVLAYRGELGAADADLDAAAVAFSRLGEEIRGAEVVHNRGFVAARRGDLPAALALFDEAQSRAAELGALRPEVLVDRVEVTLQAGLAEEGRALAEAAVGTLEAAGSAADVPEACLLAAKACEQAGDPAAAREWALRAVSLFGAQGRPRWRLLARYAALRAGAAGERPAPATAGRLVAIAGRLRRAGWAAQAVEADVRGAELLIGAGRLGEAGAVLGRLGPDVARMLPLERLQVRLCQSALRWATGDRRGAELALLAGLRALLAYQATLGSVELRAAGGGRASEVMSAGVSMAAATGRPARALWWMEAVRAGQHAMPESRPEGPEMAASLASLREVTAALAQGPGDRAAAALLRRRQAALEEVVRRRSRHASGGLRAPGSAVPGPEELAKALGQRLLVEYAEVGQRLVAAVMDGCECRLVELAAVAEVRRAVAGLRLALQAVLGAPMPGDAAALLGEAGLRAQGLVLAPLRLPPPRDLVLVADGPVASAPWALLPDLSGAALVVASSAGALLRAEAAAGPARAQRKVLVVVGPGLRHGGEEAEVVRQVWQGRANVLAGRRASAVEVRAAMAGAEVVHIAAHGTYRADSPLLSAVQLHDGPLTGYELAQATRAARLVVLSCCDSGMADAGGTGLGRLLAGAGAGAVVASVSPVPDAGVVGLMARFHQEIVTGASPAHALRSARQHLGGPFASPSSAGFACFGNGFLPVREGHPAVGR
jgi:tetratricopeptide (TPR) repeat protein